MEILALLGLAYVSTVLNTQIMSEHDKQAARSERFSSFPRIVNEEVSRERNQKREERKRGIKKYKKTQGCDKNFVQFPVKLDNSVGKFSALEDYYKLNETGKATSKFPTANGYNIEYEQAWAPIKK